MARDINFNFLGGYDSVAVRQTRRGCLQECMGCEAKTEMYVTHPENKEDKYLYVLEDTSFFNRLCLKGNRPFIMNVSWPDATAETDPKFATFDRPFRCPVGTCKCCCFQEIIASAGGSVIGSTIEKSVFNSCVPQFDVKDASGNTKYAIHVQTCCGGCCMDCCAGGCCSMKIPFYIYDPAQDEPGKHLGEITKVWGGLSKELLTDADTFIIKYPTNADATTKANLLGSTFLINQLFFESQE